MTRNLAHTVITFRDTVKKIYAIFIEYSVTDISYSLLISSLWLPNIASIVKQQLLYSIFLSISVDSFSKEDKIKEYSDFRQLLIKISPLLPDFFWIEDYVPEIDWGEIKFHHESLDYRIFYGGEIENIYDYLMLFQVLYSTRDEKYLELEFRSPKEELRETLALQDAIITGITTQPSLDDLEIRSGDFQIPSEEYWNQTINFFRQFKPINYVSEQFLNRNSCNPGSISIKTLNINTFTRLAYEGLLLPYYFIRVSDRFIPILPRRYSLLLIEDWGKIFSKHEPIFDEERAYEKHIASKIFGFLHERQQSKSLFPFVCAVTPDGQPHEIVFSCSFIAKDRLVLVYTPSPFSSGRRFGKKLSTIVPKLKEALKLISISPITLGLLGDGQIVKYDQNSRGEYLKPELLIVLSQTSTQSQKIILKEEVPGRVTFLDQFLGLFDELEDVDDFCDFLTYVEKNEPLLSIIPYGLLDLYGSYKDSSGVLINGAVRPTMISLDPHWGSNYRFKSLSDFWQQYPRGGFFDHPRSWRIETISGKNVRLIARGHFRSAIYCELSTSCIFSTAPFDRMSYVLGLISNTLMEVLEDNIRRNHSLIETLRVFKNYPQVQVNFFPWAQVIKDNDLKHLKHLDPAGKVWKSDVGWVSRGVPCVRVVFDDNKVGDILEVMKDSSLEIDLLTEVLGKLNSFSPDPSFVFIKEKLDKLKANKPRFKMLSIQKEVSFPEFISPLIPSSYYHKEAVNRVAEICKVSGFTPGEYGIDEAEIKLNTVREQLVSYINQEISRYNFENSMPYLIERTDALVFDYERHVSHIKISMEHDVDYRREEKFAKKHDEFIRYHRAYRYLIEKFVQLEPAGDSTINNDQFQYLAALSDQIQNIYADSDSIHYGVYQAGVCVDDDYMMDVKHSVDLSSMEQAYLEEEAQIRLGIIGNDKDSVSSPRPIEDFIEVLNNAFYTDMGFGIKNMVNVLHVLSQWPGYVESAEEHTWYMASTEQITSVCTRNIVGIKDTEVPLILDFLTIKKTEVVQLEGKQVPEPDIPVWEHRKRSSRYNLKPLIIINGNYLWGPYSVWKSGILWAQTPPSGRMPYDMSNTSIQKVVEEEKKLVESALVDKTVEILNRYTMHIEKNIDLSKRDKAGKHPLSIGDYDVLALLPEKNVILNIENKDLLPPFCLKDAKRLRDRIFGRAETNDGYLVKVERREDYLQKNILKISQLVHWPVDPSNLPRVISLFISRQGYWWTKFPPRLTDIVFLRIDLLDEFIKTI